MKFKKLTKTVPVFILKILITDLNRECLPKEIAGDIYQNQHCSSTANESGNTYEMPLSPNKQPTYEEIDRKDGRKEEYEALSF